MCVPLFVSPEIALLGFDAGVMRVHRIAGQHLGADDLLQFRRGGLAVQSRGDQDANAGARNAAALEGRRHVRQHLAIRRRAGDVADGDRGRFLATGEFRQRGRADRVIERRGDGPALIRQAIGEARFQHLGRDAVGNLNVLAGLVKSESNSHG